MSCGWNKEDIFKVLETLKIRVYFFCFSSSQLKVFYPHWHCYKTVPLHKKVMSEQYPFIGHLIRVHRHPRCKKTAGHPHGLFDELSLVLFLWELFSFFHTSDSDVFSSQGNPPPVSHGAHCLFSLCAVLSLFPLWRCWWKRKASSGHRLKLLML